MLTLLFFAEQAAPQCFAPQLRQKEQKMRKPITNKSISKKELRVYLPLDGILWNICYLNDHLDMPEVELVDRKDFPCDKMLAMFNGNGYKICIAKDLVHDGGTKSLDLMFALALEMRRVWQNRYYYDKYLRDYKPIEECKNAKEYYLQAAVIDDYAWGWIFLNSYDADPRIPIRYIAVRRRIKKRVKEIRPNFFPEPKEKPADDTDS